MNVTDKVMIELEISELIDLVLHLADGTEYGDGVSDILVNATPEDVKDFIIDKLGEGKY